MNEVKVQNEKMKNMKKNMRSALLDKLGQNSDVYMQAISAQDKQQLI